MSFSVLRPTVALLATVSVVAAGAATAAPKKPAAPAPVCNLVQDPKGDDGSTAFKHSESLDIVGADIASNAKLVTAVIRVAKYSATDSSAAPTGRAWYLEFSVPDSSTPLYLGAQITPAGGTRYNYGWVDGTTRRTLGNAEGVVDEAKSELRISAPVGIWAETGPTATIPTKGGTVKPGSKVTNLAAASYNYVGVTTPTGSGGGSLQPGDTAAATKAYIAGTPSCVTVGA